MLKMLPKKLETIKNVVEKARKYWKCYFRRIPPPGGGHQPPPSPGGPPHGDAEKITKSWKCWKYYRKSSKILKMLLKKLENLKNVTFGDPPPGGWHISPPSPLGGATRGDAEKVTKSWKHWTCYRKRFKILKMLTQVERVTEKASKSWKHYCSDFEDV